ncbi:MAG: hypothetical protein A2252_06670 [Elusimicrobia bacterium RIFOXYA2_FULL_39_19]|nr:MAG: hypothetical protein A2252_06670 [Elusimicrobia bacterium RIFOXYA2_FULL_39_19]
MNKILQIIKQETKSNQKVWIVGGYLRDILLKKPCSDIDFVVSRNVLALAKHVATRLKCRVITLDNVNRIYRIVLKQEAGIITLDFSLMAGKNIEEDLARRDFTINAMSLPLSMDTHSFKSKLIDPFNGVSDIHTKTIRAITEKNFKDDPLRLLRAYRFSAELDFTVEPKTEKQIKKHAKLISKPAKERIREELVKIFAVKNASGFIYKIDEQKLFEIIFPEISKMKKSSRKFYFHPEGLWQHSKQTLSSLEKLINEHTWATPELHKKISNHVALRLPLFKITTLFHDCGKPGTVARIDGRIRFFNHEAEGSKEIKKILQRLRFSNKEVQIAEKLVKSHMRPGNVAQNFHKGTLSKKATYRFFRDMGDETIDLLLLSLADRMSYIGVTAKPKEIEMHTIFVNRFAKRFFDYKIKSSRPKLIDGYQVMKALNLPSGPLVGKVLAFVEEAQLSGKINNAPQAITLIRKNLSKIKRSSAIN